MICKRLIACLDVCNGIVFKGTKFKELCSFSNTLDLSKKYFKDNIDEIVYLNICGNSIKDVCRDISVLKKFVNIPLTVGGNINSFHDAQMLFKNGADKISLNSTLYYNKNIVRSLKLRYGSQCIVASIDVKKLPDGSWNVFINGGRFNTGIEIINWCHINRYYGVGEFLLTSIDRDGTNKGYDICLFFLCSGLLFNPIIASGGGGYIDSVLDILSFSSYYYNPVYSVLLASSLHRGLLSISDIKSSLFNFFCIRT